MNKQSADFKYGINPTRLIRLHRQGRSGMQNIAKRQGELTGAHPAGKEFRELKSKLIVAVTGKACQASRLFGLICQEYGNLTLGELAKGLSNGYCMIWRAEDA